MNTATKPTVPVETDRFITKVIVFCAAVLLYGVLLGAFVGRV